MFSRSISSAYKKHYKLEIPLLWNKKISSKILQNIIRYLLENQQHKTSFWFEI